jgi:hypothetical protein
MTTLSAPGGQPLPVAQRRDQIHPPTSDATSTNSKNEPTSIDADHLTTIKQPPNLLTIPVEVRELILRHLLSTDMEENSYKSYQHYLNHANVEEDEHTVDSLRRDYPRGRVQKVMIKNCVTARKYKLHLNVLWTCNQLFSEGSKILLSENKYLAIKHVSQRDYLETCLDESGVKTFWRYPGIFKSAKPSQFRPIITLDLKAFEPDSPPYLDEYSLFIIPFSELGRVCKAISSFMAFAVSLRFDYFTVNLEIQISSLLAWKGRGPQVIFSHLQNNLFDWIGQIIGQITFVGPYSNLPKEGQLRSWLLQQPYSMGIPTLRQPEILVGTGQLSAAQLRPIQQRGQDEMCRLVRRFRKAEMDFLCKDYAATFEAFGDLSAMIVFLTHYEFRPFRFDGRVQELLLWSHFYMGLRLVEEKDAVAKFIYEDNKESCRMTSAALYLPEVDSWKSYCARWQFQSVVTPGQEVRLLFANVEVSCECPFPQERIPRCKRYTEKNMALMTSGQSVLDFKEIKDLCASPEFTIAAFQKAKAGIKQSIAQQFGPLLPVTLTFEPYI